MPVRLASRIPLMAAVLATLLGSASRLRADVVAHWTFDALQNGVYPDSSPKGTHPATPESRSSVVPFTGTAKFGHAVMLNGKQDSYLTIPALDFAKGSFTICVWFNANASARSPILADWANPNFSYLFEVQPSSDAKDVALWGELRSPEITPAEVKSRKNRRLISVAKLPASIPIHLNEWHHAAWVWTKTDASHANMAIYLDGEPDAQEDQQRAPVDVLINNNTARIGYREDDKQKRIFSGALDELWVFNTALSVDQIKNIMNTNTLTGSAVIVKAPANPNPQIAAVTPPRPADSATPPVLPPAPDGANPNVAPAAPTVTPSPGDQAPPAAAETPANPAVADNTQAPDAVPPPAPELPPTVSRPPLDVSAGLAKPLAVAPPRGYSPTRLAGLATSSLIALTLASYLLWAFSERSKLTARRR